jgi:SAM-dependent methyltransferase
MSEGTDRTNQEMRAFWDAKARENAMWFIHSDLDYANPDEAEFWSSGRDNLDRTLSPFGLTLQPADTVVEIGCGIGRMTRALAERAGHVVGIDVSAEMIEQGRRALADLDNVELLVGSGTDLTGVPDKSATVVFSFIVFQHIPDPEITCSYIREMGRVLRPGGWALFQVSEEPAVHQRSTWERSEGARARLARMFGRRPKGCLEAQWLGSAVPRPRLMAALDEGGLVLDGTIGDGTQYCMVHAHRS